MVERMTVTRRKMLNAKSILNRAVTRFRNTPSAQNYLLLQSAMLDYQEAWQPSYADNHEPLIEN